MTESPQTRWLLLSFSLPGRAASTGRVRLWRALKDLGAGSLRDGIAVLPATAAARTAFARLATAITADSGATWLLELPVQASAVEQALTGLFDRTADWFFTFLPSFLFILVGAPVVRRPARISNSPPP